ncbi:MAG: transporter [Spirochaetaceae bacterium]|nr:MAG: transporter [Spirochaetaceae bacterium]
MAGIKRHSHPRPRRHRSQIPLGILFGLLVLWIGIRFLRSSPTLAFFWFTGIAFGFVLQKARFCFTASMRDAFLTGRTRLTKAVLVAFAITSVGFWALMFGAHQSGRPIPGMAFVAPLGLHTVAGAFLFGLGMVIAGGCASGTLMRVGEGFTMQIIALLFFIIGSLLGAAHFRWWDVTIIQPAPRVHLPQLFGWFGSIAIQLVIIALLWIAADKYGKARQHAATGRTAQK